MASAGITSTRCITSTFFDARALRRALESSGFDAVETETVPMFRYARPGGSMLLTRLPR
jgi:hypothetical protein